MSPRENFIDALLAVSGREHVDADTLTASLRESILEFGSETNENVECAENVHLSDVEMFNDWTSRVITVGEKRVPVADIMNFAEGVPVPVEVQEQFPSLSRADWDAALRLVTLVVSALHRSPAETIGP